MEAWFGPGLRICLPIHRQRSGMFAAQCFWVPLSIVFLASRPKRWHSSGATSPWKWDTLILPKPFIEDRDDRVPPLFVWLWLEGSWNCTRQMVVKIRLGGFGFIYCSLLRNIHGLRFFIDLILCCLHFQQDFRADDFNGVLSCKDNAKDGCFS